uniref:Uncharacterized protein n=1 Tax=Arion vulgaris TaxID=1028688 RepID=A0A0B7A278_9EUPU
MGMKKEAQKRIESIKNIFKNMKSVLKKITKDKNDNLLHIFIIAAWSENVNTEQTDEQKSLSLQNVAIQKNRASVMEREAN